ncbi:hypothetical protein AALO_G00028180 [Alosa alosa]|uniref:Uncharacterized protein n=1 Tax=Alosa alosa TaxID=278164 RepID=A0AAV6HBQ6_9TELE|nr:hypothetical protein AALO_G00028180 [Alosa alosa]
MYSHNDTELGVWSCLVPIPLDQHLPSDLVVVSHWQAENDGDCDDQGDAKETSDIQSDLISGPQEPPPEATAPAQDQSLQNKRLVRRPLMSLKTIRPLRKFGQLQAIVATRRSHSIPNTAEHQPPALVISDGAIKAFRRHFSFLGYTLFVAGEIENPFLEAEE